MNCIPRNTFLSCLRGKGRHFLVIAFLCCVIFTSWHLGLGRNEHPKVRASDTKTTKTKKRAHIHVSNHACAKDGAGKALLVSYMRSGTTFLGSTFERNKNIFYVFEPEWDLIMMSLNEYKPLHFINGSVRPPVGIGNEESAIQALIENYLCCNIEAIDIQSLRLRFLQKGQHTQSLFRCLRKENSTIQCVRDFTRTCKSKNFRFLKTVRVRMSVIEELLRRYPNLRVIHLIRDPRGIAVSRMKWGEYYAAGSTFTFGKVCAEMLRDIDTVKNMSPELSRRVLPVLYEDVAEHPQAMIKTLYEFLHLDMPGYIRGHIKHVTNATRDAPDMISSVRQNSSKSAHAWRGKIHYNLCKRLDEMCSRVYQQTGYLSVKSESHLRNLSTPLRKANGDYLHSFGHFIQQKLFPDKF